ncbi:PAIRED AMPHIPATHIC HELIX SIN3-LIKE PROTEIN-RELATED [Salix koriyanagi]|uniref:PAIRED AMPHIPATHIC HELIX SIN3-LIKE PROTEIN-RELATED n=1 Tax=Salix koriyanagi TaxID=2511006 RepID=A0A9Q0X276_9ROSI|nr:PAIRED AMPHIPATHIC HELIX SIN3-LIKE PROTEIN-RELATED [Salix koriyanagi]
MNQNGDLSHGDCSDPSKTYIRALKARFHDQPEKFHSFYKVMMDIMAQRVRPDGLGGIPDGAPARLKAILEGHDDLIGGLNFFLPPSHRVSLDDEVEAGPVTAEGAVFSGFEDAKDLIKKARMRGDVVELFIDDPDLLESFRQFMPVYEPIPLASYAPNPQIPVQMNTD